VKVDKHVKSTVYITHMSLSFFAVFLHNILFNQIIPMLQVMKKQTAAKAEANN